MTTTIHPASASLIELDRVRGIADKSEQAFQIARQFEALLIEEVVKSARAESGGWLGDGADKTSESVAQMGEQFLARALASGGGFGLASQFAPLIQRDLQQAGAIAGSAQTQSAGNTPTQLR